MYIYCDEYYWNIIFCLAIQMTNNIWAILIIWRKTSLWIFFYYDMYDLYYRIYLKYCILTFIKMWCQLILLKVDVCCDTRTRHPIPTPLKKRKSKKIPQTSIFNCIDGQYIYKSVCVYIYICVCEIPLTCGRFHQFIWSQYIQKMYNFMLKFLKQTLYYKLIVS